MCSLARFADGRPLAGAALLTGLSLGAAPALAQPACPHDDALARTAAALALADGPVDGARLVRVAREAGSDAPAFHAIAIAPGDDVRRAAWLLDLSVGAEGSLACGEAASAGRTILVAAPLLGHLVVVGEGPPYRVRASLERELLSPVLYVLDAEGHTTAHALDASPAELDIDPDVSLPARLQLVATGEHGPRPIAVLELGAGAPAVPAAPSGDDVTPRERLRWLGDPDDPSPLRVSHLLDRVALAHAEAVCAAGLVGHELEPGREPEARLRASGVAARHVGEVVARGDDEAAAWTALATSPSHLLALRDRRFTDAGIGTASDAEGRMCVVVLLAAWPRWVGVGE